MDRILIVAAHPDDEILGCGGTLRRHVISGDYVQTVFMGSGVGAREDEAETAVRERQKMAISAGRLLGTQPPIFLDFPDNEMDRVPLLEMAKAIEIVVERVDPDVVYTHSKADLNIDHQLTNRAVMTACRPLPWSRVRSIYFFEVLSSTEWSTGDNSAGFQPRHFVDIEETISEKLAATEFYRSEMRSPPHPRSIEGVKALATVRGLSAGSNSAEAFEVGRTLVPKSGKTTL